MGDLNILKGGIENVKISDLKISIITATFNSVETIDDCLSSVSSQTYLNREHIVIDGDSLDGTLEVLRSRNNAISVLISEPDKGIYDALNKGIMHITGDIVGFLHADDIYENENILSRIAEAFTDPTVSAVYGDLQYVQKEDLNKVVRRWNSSPFNVSQLAKGWMPPHPTLYVRSEWYKRLGGFDTNYKISADYYSILELFTQVGFKSKYIPEVFVKMRLGGVSNRSFKNIYLKSCEDMNALRRTGVGGIGTLFYKNFRKIIQFL